jgi:hypothetical protein
MKIITHIPTFQGFYESIWEHSDMLYDEAYEYIQDKELSIHDVVDIIDDHTDWEGYRQAIAEYIVECWEATLQHHDLAKSVTLDSIYSPRTYNFATDSINVEVAYTAKQRDRLNELFQKHSDEISKWITQQYTSRSGFHSYHSNDIHDEEWVYWYKDEHKFMVVVNWILQLEFDEDLSDDNLYYDSPRIWEAIDFEAVDNTIYPFKASEWICEKTGDPLNEYNYFDSETIRLANIFEKVYGKKPDVLSFEAVKARKFPWFDELSEEEQAEFLDPEKKFLWAHEIYQSKTSEVTQ